jgi:triacylglycerol lipase
VRIVSALLSALVSTMLFAVAPAQASTQASYPVPYNFLPYALIGGTQDNQPGANDWSCKPSAEHPEPVVLVHGLLGNKSTNWPTYAPLLANNGYCVFALTYGQRDVPGYDGDTFGGLTAMEQSAKQLKAFVAKVLAATGASKVDIVGHSEGTLMPNYYVKFLGGAKYVDQYISIAPLWHGTQMAALANAFEQTGQDSRTVMPLCESCTEFAPDSAFMKKMRKGGVAVPGVEYTNIVTEYDELVVPYTSGIQKGMTNYVLQDGCNTDYSEHFEIVSDRRASVIVLNTLDPASAQPLPCDYVAPFVGGPPPGALG